MRTQLLATALATAAFAVTAQASNIIEWNFTGLTGGSGGTSVSTTTFASTTANTDLVTPINLVKGSGLGTPGTGTVNTWQFNGAGETSLASALTANDYMSFTITPDEGFKFSVDSISLLGSRGGQTNVSVALFSSVGGFTAVNQLGMTQLITSTTIGSPTTISFASLGLTDLTSSTEFRLYFWGTTNPDASTPSNAVGVRLGDSDTSSAIGLAVTGSVSPIPEPSSFAALAGLGALGMVASRRRRRA